MSSALLPVPPWAQGSFSSVLFVVQRHAFFPPEYQKKRPVLQSHPITKVSRDRNLSAQKQDQTFAKNSKTIVIAVIKEKLKLMGSFLVVRNLTEPLVMSETKHQIQVI